MLLIFGTNLVVNTIKNYDNNDVIIDKLNEIITKMHPLKHTISNICLWNEDKARLKLYENTKKIWFIIIVFVCY